MPRILFVCSEQPVAGNGGVAIASSQAIAALSEIFDTETIFLSRPDASKRQNIGLRMSNSIARRLVGAIALDPLFVGRFYSTDLVYEMRSRFAQRHYDVVHLDGIGMAQYIALIPKSSRSVLSINDCYSLALADEARFRAHGARKLMLQFYSKLVARYEARVFRSADAVKVVAAGDAAQARSLGARRVLITPNGVDIASLEPLSGLRRETACVFLGSLAGGNENEIRMFIHNVWRKVYSVTGVRLIVFGRGASKSFRAWLSGEDGILHKGEAPSLEFAYQHGNIAIVPMRKSCGVFNKILEMMAAGLTVCSYQESFSGILGVANGDEYLGASDNDMFVRNVRKCISDRALTENMGLRARAAVAKYHSLEISAIRLQDAYRSILCNVL